MYALESAMDELAVAAGHRPGRAARPQRARPGAGERPAVQLPQPRRVPAGGRREVRLGATATRRRGRAAAAGGCSAPGVAAATYPARPARGGGGAGRAGRDVHRPDRRRRHRHRRPHRARRRSPPTRSRSTPAGCAWRSATAPCRRRRSRAARSGRRPGARAVVRACEALRDRLDGAVPPEGIEASADTAEEAGAREPYARHAFGAHFAEVEVDADTGEVRVPRMLGVFAAGRIVNPLPPAPSSVGGMTMGLVDGADRGERHGRARSGTSSTTTSPSTTSRPTPTSAGSTRVAGGGRPAANPVGAKGIGEIGIVGAAAAIANAVHHATGRPRPRPADHPGSAAAAAVISVSGHSSVKWP